MSHGDRMCRVQTSVADAQIGGWGEMDRSIGTETPASCAYCCLGGRGFLTMMRGVCARTQPSRPRPGPLQGSGLRRRRSTRIDKAPPNNPCVTFMHNISSQPMLASPLVVIDDVHPTLRQSKVAGPSVSPTVHHAPRPPKTCLPAQATRNRRETTNGGGQEELWKISA